MERSFTKIGESIFPPSRQPYLSSIFDSLKFRTGGTVSAACGLAVRSLQDQGVLRKVAAIAESPALAPFGLFAIESRFTTCTQRIYFADRGTDLIPLAIDTMTKEDQCQN